MKKAQALSLPFVYISIAIISVAILIFGFLGIQQLNKANTEVQLTDFITTLQNKLTRERVNANSVAPVTFSLPSTINTVCFVDRNTDITALANKDLNQQLSIYQDDNIFLGPSVMTYKLDYLSIAAAENPLCVKVLNGKLKINLLGQGNTTRIAAASAEAKAQECVSVLYHDVPENSLDLVFLGYGYGNVQAFSSDVNKYIATTLFEIEPFKSNKEKISVYRVDDFSIDCTIGDWIGCDQYSVNQKAANCPHDYIVVLADRSIINIVDGVRSSAVGNIVKINTAPDENSFVLMHELGHAVGGLADEYVYPSYEGFNPENYPNCDTTSCQKWQSIPDCVMGCTLGNYYRPTQTSLMKEIKSPYDYGPVNTKALSDVFAKYGETSG